MDGLAEDISQLLRTHEQLCWVGKIDDLGWIYVATKHHVRNDTTSVDSADKLIGIVKTLICHAEFTLPITNLSAPRQPSQEISNPTEKILPIEILKIYFELPYVRNSARYLDFRGVGGVEEICKFLDPVHKERFDFNIEELIHHKQSNHVILDLWLEKSNETQYIHDITGDSMLSENINSYLKSDILKQLKIIPSNPFSQKFQLNFAPIHSSYQKDGMDLEIAIKKARSIIKELIATEASYLMKIGYLKDYFHIPLKSTDSPLDGVASNLCFCAWK